MIRRMEPPPALLLQTLISLSLFSFAANQNCTDYSYLIICEPRRSTQATYDDMVDTPICDEAIDEGIWFRFSSYAGEAIVEREPNDPVPVLHCGTEIPIYISGLGSHPVTDNTATTATVCANYGGVDPCQWTATIQIYSCPGYYLYKLKSPPGCSIAYCVGNESVCDVGKYWNGFSCVNYLPAMTDLPIFSGPNISGSNLSEEIYFGCEVQYDRQPNDSYARFRVTFLFDGMPLENIGVGARPPKRLQPTVLNPDSSLVAVLDELHLRGRLGREISCKAESFWDGNSETSPSIGSVGKYYAAFESTAESYTISLTNGSTFNVEFESTLPLTCSHCVIALPGDVDSCCRYRFRMKMQSASSRKCYFYWIERDRAAVTAYFVPEATQAGNSFAVVFEPYNDDERWGYGQSLWRDYVIPTVIMAIIPQSTPYKACSSSGDPHLITFDGFRYNIFLEGDFYLVKAINDNQTMEIQVRHEICNGGMATCLCGVIVREGNSAIKISICDGQSWSEYVQRSPVIVARLLSQNPADSSTVFIDDMGLRYSVRMPSGLRVEVDVSRPWFNVEVYLPPVYHGKTDSDSMCGNCDDNADDDYTPDQDIFRIPDSLSYFAEKPNCSSIFNVALTMCGCNSSTVVKCSNTDPTLEYITTSKKAYPGYLPLGKVCFESLVAPEMSLQRQLSLYDSSNSENDYILDDDILFPPYTYDPNFGVNVSFTWPTPKGKTEQEVEQYCADTLQSSPAYADCSAKADLTALIAMCASDIQIADDWISVSAYAYIFQQDCLNKIAATINSSSDSSSSNSSFEVLAFVSGKLCPNQCSGRGTCSEGTCTCTTGYIGADCSIDKTLPPSLTGIIRRGVCDVRKRPCNVISVYGGGVAFSSALKCRFTDQSTGAHVETDGTFINAVEYSCPVPATTTHRRRRSVTTRTTALSAKNVSVTIDGVLYSNTLDFVLFDSVCMECNRSDTCWQTDNSCLINEECFANGAVNSDDPCLKCDPSVSRDSWTNVTAVENWKPCTRNCDTGVVTRNTVCGTTVTNVDVEFCNLLDCPDNAEQETEGFVITLSSEDLKLILLDPVGSLVPFSDALNQYCSNNAAACCSSIGIPTHASNVTYTSPDRLTYASGYPVINSTDTSLKIIVKIDRARLEAECSETQTQGSNSVYADPMLIYDAVTSEKSEIEQALSITITSVWSTTSLPTSTLRTSTADQSTTFEWTSTSLPLSTLQTSVLDLSTTYSEWSSILSPSSTLRTSASDQSSTTSEWSSTPTPSSTLRTSSSDQSITSESSSTSSPSSTPQTSTPDKSITSESSSTSLPSSTPQTVTPDQSIATERSSTPSTSSTLRTSTSDQSITSARSSKSTAPSTLRRSTAVSIIYNLISFWAFVILVCNGLA